MGPMLEEAGYHSTPAFTAGTDYSFGVEWYRGSKGGNAPYPFLLVASDGDFNWYVFADDFPSAIEVFHKLTAIAQAAVIQDVWNETAATREDENEKTESLKRHRHEERKRREAARSTDNE
jgi:hypothetical protein